jgi:peroxiredoxin
MGKKNTLFAFGLVFLAGLAWWAGNLFAVRLSSEKIRHNSQRKLEMTNEIVNANFVLSSGNKWPDVALQNLEGEWVSFAELLQNNTLLIFMQPGCDACEEELDALKGLLSDNESSSRVILVSNAYPLELATLRKARSIRSTILIDRSGDLFGQFSAIVYPLNIVIGRDMRIMSVNAGQLSRQQVDSLLR